MRWVVVGNGYRIFQRCHTHLSILQCRGWNSDEARPSSLYNRRRLKHVQKNLQAKPKCEAETWSIDQCRNYPHSNIHLATMNFQASIPHTCHNLHQTEWTDADTTSLHKLNPSPSNIIPQFLAPIEQRHRAIWRECKKPNTRVAREFSMHQPPFTVPTW